MAPELICNQPYNHCVDLWSLGVISYELYYGTPPFVADGFPHLMRVIKTHVRTDSCPMNGMRVRACVCVWGGVLGLFASPAVRAVNLRLLWYDCYCCCCCCSFWWCFCWQTVEYGEPIGERLRSFLQGLLVKDPKQRLQWPELLDHPLVTEVPRSAVSDLPRLYDLGWNNWTATDDVASTGHASSLGDGDVRDHSGRNGNDAAADVGKAKRAFIPLRALASPVPDSGVVRRDDEDDNDADDGDDLPAPPPSIGEDATSATGTASPKASMTTSPAKTNKSKGDNDNDHLPRWLKHSSDEFNSMLLRDFSATATQLRWPAIERHNGDDDLPAEVAGEKEGATAAAAIGTSHNNPLCFFVAQSAPDSSNATDATDGTAAAAAAAAAAPANTGGGSEGGAAKYLHKAFWMRLVKRAKAASSPSKALPVVGQCAVECYTMLSATWRLFARGHAHLSPSDLTCVRWCCVLLVTLTRCSLHAPTGWLRARERLLPYERTSVCVVG